MCEDDLERLLRRAQDGDRDAVGVLLERYAGRIRAAIHRRLSPQMRRRVETEDIFQSTVALTLEDVRGMRYQGEDAFIGWLTTVAERRLLMNVRRHRAQRRDVRREVALQGASGVAAELTSPPRGAERAELQADIEQAIARLPPLERQVIQLRSYEGLSHRAIAEAMQLPNKDAARHLFLKALRRMGEFVDRGDSARDP